MIKLHTQLHCIKQMSEHDCYANLLSLQTTQKNRTTQTELLQHILELLSKTHHFPKLTYNQINAWDTLLGEA